jgi:hypothetical protein
MPPGSTLAKRRAYSISLRNFTEPFVGILSTSTWMRSLLSGFY